MTQYNIVNVDLPDSQLKKLKSETKNETISNLRLSSNMLSSSNNETGLQDELLLTKRQIANLHKAFTINFLSNINSNIENNIIRWISWLLNDENDGKRVSTISLNVFDTIRINSSSISSRPRNSFKRLLVL